VVQAAKQEYAADATNASKKRAVNRQRYEEQQSEVIARAAAYQKAHPEVRQAVQARRKVRGCAGQDAMDRALSVAYRLAIAHDACFYCHASETHHVDHYVPLAKGGTDHWWNLVRSCRLCNQRKHTMHGDEFLLLMGGGDAGVKSLPSGIDGI
jgi:hypothetical protein